MTVSVVPITEEHAAGFRACLDAVAREKRYLAQVEALPLERVAAFLQDSVKNNAAHYVALDDGSQLLAATLAHARLQGLTRVELGVYFDTLAMGLLFDAAPP